MKKSEILKTFKKFVENKQIVKSYLKEEITKEELESKGIKLSKDFKTLTKKEVEANRPKNAYE